MPIRRLMASAVRRLAGEDPAAAALRRKLDAATRRVAELRARIEQLTAQRHRTNDRIAALKRGLDELRAKSLTERRFTLSDEVIAQLLPVRSAHPRRLAYERDLADARERRFIETSQAYRDTIAETARESSLQCTEISGVRWWVPLDARLPERVERAVAQSFPFGALLQTREIAVGGVMLDIGANIGRTSVSRAILGDVRAVYAAEPEPSNYACLVQNVVEHRMRGFVLPDRVAIGAERSEVRLHQSKYMGGHRVVAATDKRAAESVAVQVWPLDDWIAHHGIEPEAITFVKVDTQGFEVNVLRGATKLLAQDGVGWQIEIDPDLLSKAGTSVSELLALLERHFTHAIDMGPREPGSRVIPVNRLAESLSHVGSQVHKTDVLLYRMPAGRGPAC